MTDVEPGDFVILNWRAVCGRCRACRRGRPQHCFDTHNAAHKMTLLDGTGLSPALGIGAFAEKTLVAAGQCTKVAPAASPAAAGLLGIGLPDHHPFDPGPPPRAATGHASAYRARSGHHQRR